MGEWEGGATLWVRLCEMRVWGGGRGNDNPGNFWALHDAQLIAVRGKVGRGGALSLT